jgi:Domain of unknown function (DUF5660)
MSNTKSKSRQNFVNPLELGREAVHTVQKGAVDEAQQSAKSFISQLLGIDFDENAGKNAHDKKTVSNENIQEQAKAGEIFNSAKHHATAESHKVHADKAPKPHIEAAIDYHGKFTHDIVKSREKASKTELHEMQRNIEQIKVELTKLVASSSDLKMEFASIAVEQSTPEVGQYHLNFFEWMLIVIKSARQKVEDSQSWVGAIKGKGTKKSYWGMFKKHGTTFGLSGERAVATQVG